MNMSLRCLVDIQYAYKDYFKQIENIANVLFSAYSKKTSPFLFGLWQQIIANLKYDFSTVNDTVIFKVLGNLELTSYHLHHHELIVKSPVTYESTLGNRGGEIRLSYVLIVGFQRSDDVSTLRL